MKTLLIDGNYLGHLSFHTMGDLTSDDGLPSGVVFGFLSRCVELGHRFTTNRFVFCWDSPNSVRREQYPQYKAQRREKSPEERERYTILYTQINALKNDLLPRIGWKNQLEQDGLEADDVLTACARECSDQSIIVTSDEDLFQCLNEDKVRIYNPGKRRLWNETEFISEYNIIPSQWAMVKALAGCTSDNVPGVMGVGEKTALRFLRAELPTESKKYAAISRALKIGEVEQMMKLVCLPHAKTNKHIELQEDALGIEQLLAIAEEYDMTSFMKGDALQRWTDLFDRNFSAKASRSPYNTSNKARRQATDRIKNSRRARRGFAL